MAPPVTEAYEHRLWEELLSLLAKAVPESASEAEAEDIVLLALNGQNREIYELYRTVRKLAGERAGYLAERLEEDNPVTQAHKRLYGQWA